MNIRDIPADYATFENFNRDYEKTHYRLTEASWRVGAALRLHGTLAGLLPARHLVNPVKFPSELAARICDRRARVAKHKIYELAGSRYMIGGIFTAGKGTSA